MRQLLVLFLLTVSLNSLSQVIDSLQVTTTYDNAIGDNQVGDTHENFEDDFEPGLILFALFAIGFMFICIGVGIVLTIIGLLVLFGLIGAGILSASILVGLHNKSFEKGFKTFLVSVTTAGGFFIGATGCWLLNKIVHWFTTQKALIIGSIGGLVTGLLLGIFLFYVIRKLTTFLNTLLKTT